ncbi:MAG: hypothetical protein ACT4QC_04510 [Planctomycetaceae bacterium]
MSRAILLAWLPCCGWLLAATVALWLVGRLSGARPAPAKLRRLYGCEAGSVQTLSFVFTLPLFIMLVMFIVQVADLMIGIAGVHYAAFAAARAAIVWLPAEVPPPREAPSTFLGEPANTLYPGTLGARGSGGAAWQTDERDNSGGQSGAMQKYLKIWSAAAMACMPISPSRSYFSGDDQAQPASSAILTVYPSLAPSGRKYPRYDRVIRRKFNYAIANTRIRMEGLDRDIAQGPTYNPPLAFNPNEVGWEDPVTVTVFHYFALLPGPGRFLATRLSGPGTPDSVSGRIVRPGDMQGFGFTNNNPYRQYLKAVPLSASVTMSNEGLKSVMPYAQPID